MSDYIMIITDEPFIVQEAEHNSIKVEFLPVGGSFLCKQYKGFRPSLIIDQTSDVSYERFSSHKVNAWVDAFIDSFDRRGVKVEGEGIVARRCKHLWQEGV